MDQSVYRRATGCTAGVRFPGRERDFLLSTLSMESRHSAIGITSGYGLDDTRVGVRVPVQAIIFTSACHPDRLWGPPSLLSNGSLPGGKAAEA
jgi:hypothetical protein